MPGLPGMYGEQSANTNLKALMNVQDINSITNVTNGIIASESDIVKRARVIEYFYDKVLLDTIELGSEENVFLKYCKTKELPEGHTKLLLRRWGGLTEHTVSLIEGVPPKSDRMSSESFTGVFKQYGRYMEFTDRVDFNLIDPVIAMYSAKLGDVAIRTAERLCRENLIHYANPIYANGEGSIENLMIGDTVGIEDYRLQALVFNRILVKPLNGCYVIICSPEHQYDLINDPLVQRYMELTHTAEPMKTGKPIELFNLRFETTMLDDYAYSYTDISNPGEYDIIENGVTKKVVRLVTVLNEEITEGAEKYPVGTEVYLNWKESTSNARTETGEYIKNGSYIPNRVKWDVAKITSDAKLSGEPVTIRYTDTDGSIIVTNVTLAPGNLLDYLKSNSTGNKAKWYQLPVHRSFMFGEDFLVKTGISGRGGAKFYVKPKGSAGVLDPIDQRQSIGYKIDTLGFTCIRPEALVQYVFVPKNALLTYQSVLTDWDLHYNDEVHKDKDNKK